jgi:UDP-N-acetyl-D-mannosaminuronic acid transferase (WecB/TagA/CpsF family)
LDELNMTSLPSVNLLGVNVSRVDYDGAVAAIIRAARLRLSFGATALAVHGVMEARRDPALAELINRLHLIAPDGQPVRWALNLLGAKELKDRVYGPHADAENLRASRGRPVTDFSLWQQPSGPRSAGTKSQSSLPQPHHCGLAS